MKMTATTTRTNPDMFKNAIKRVEDMSSGFMVAGFPAGTGLESPHYSRKNSDGGVDAGLSIMKVAGINNAGAKINHPGGTPYFTRPDKMMQFVSKHSPAAASLPQTKPHTIDIPARRFMEAAQPAIREAALKLHKEYMERINNGTAEPFKQHMEFVGMVARDCIVSAIDATTSPANAASTINRKKSSKPLEDSGDMKNAATFQWRENE